MAKWFKDIELYRSETADRLGIDNTPTEDIWINLRVLMAFLDQLREAWGSGIVITSGYRCEALNKAVGGSKNSSHKYGLAVDMKPVNGKNKEFHRFVEKYLLDNHIPFDNLINEYNYSWTHLGLKNRDGKQRGLSFSLP